MFLKPMRSPRPVQAVHKRSGGAAATQPRAQRYEVNLPTARMPNYLAAIRRNAVWLLLCIAAGACLTYVGVYLRTPLYSARALVELRPLNATFLGLGDLRSESVGASGPRHSDIDTQVELLRAPDLSAQAATAVRVRFSGESDAVDLAIESLQVRPVGRGRLVEIVSQSSSSAVAAEFSNALATQFIASHRAYRVSEAERIRRILGLRAEQLGTELERAELEMARFARVNGFGDDLSVITSDLNQKIVNAQAERAAAQAQRDTGLVDERVLARARQRLNDLRLERAKLLATLTPRHPDVVRLDAQIESAGADIEAANERANSALDTTIAASMARSRLLVTRLDEHRERLFKSSFRRMRFEQLQREADASAEQLNDVMRRAEQVALLVSVAGSEIGIVQRAQAANRSTDSDPPVAVGAGALLAALAGFGVVLVRARYDNLIRTPGDLEQAATESYPLAYSLTYALGSPGIGRLELSHLGSVPRFEPTSSPRAGRLDSIHLSSRNGSRNSPIPALLDSIDLAEGRRPAWSSLAASLALIESPPQVIAITSSARSAGSTTVAIGIAAALSALGLRALVVDANSHNSEIHERTGVPLTPGLGELLDVGTGVAADSTPIHAIAESPGLYVLAAGDLCGGLPGAIVRFTEFLTECRSTFDFVIIDTPVLASGADARIVFKFADAVALVVRADQTAGPEVAGALQRLGQDGVERVFSVLNGYGSPPVRRNRWNLS
jgi:succinoglycan biosynthesis transport protein ExoP